MDPLSALSVAAAVVQFVDFGIQFAVKARGIYKSADGAVQEDLDIELELTRLRLDWDSQVIFGPGQQGPLNQRDQALKDLCSQCTELSKYLVNELESLKVAPGSKHRKWKAFERTVKGLWSQEEIDEIDKKLARLRSELDSHVLISLRCVV